MKRILSSIIAGVFTVFLLYSCENPTSTEKFSLTEFRNNSKSMVAVNPSGIYITEISDSSSYKNEFVELYNSSNIDIDLSSWTLEEYRGNNTGSTSYTSINLSGVIKSKNFALIVRNENKSAFENYFSINLDGQVNYQKNGKLIINKKYQKFVLKNGNIIEENASGNFLSNKSKIVHRNDLKKFGNSAFNFLSNNKNNATPGELSASQIPLFNGGTPPPPSKAEIEVKEGSSIINDGISNYFIGSITVNTQKDIIFTIDNLGTTALNLTGSPKVELTGSGFNLKSDALSPVIDKTTFVITYSPTVLGDSWATISINNDDADENPYNFTIKGTAIDAGTLDPYYASASALAGDALKAELNSIIKGHTILSYSQVWNALKDTDEDPQNPSNVILLYKQTSQAKNTNGGGVDDWNREHVWAKSHGNFGTAKGPGTDVHHLRPTDVTVNGSRGNLDFDLGGSIVSEAPLCKKDGDSFEPPNEVKGDVARMLFYMVVRYEGTDQYVDLELANYTGTSGPLLGKLSTLKQWHVNDPVSDFELSRNEKIYSSWQHNRNPFIDHPEWVDSIW